MSKSHVDSDNLTKYNKILRRVEQNKKYGDKLVVLVQRK
jgi:hypothetical protein